jgi:hypothetical protein
MTSCKAKESCNPTSPPAAPKALQEATPHKCGSIVARGRPAPFLNQSKHFGFSVADGLVALVVVGISFSFAASAFKQPRQRIKNDEQHARASQAAQSIDVALKGNFATCSGVVKNILSTQPTLTVTQLTNLRHPFSEIKTANSAVLATVSQPLSPLDQNIRWMSFVLDSFALISVPAPGMTETWAAKLTLSAQITSGPGAGETMTFASPLLLSFAPTNIANFATRRLTIVGCSSDGIDPAQECLQNFSSDYDPGLPTGRCRIEKLGIAANNDSDPSDEVEERNDGLNSMSANEAGIYLEDELMIGSPNGDHFLFKANPNNSVNEWPKVEFVRSGSTPKRLCLQRVAGMTEPPDPFCDSMMGSPGPASFAQGPQGPQGPANPASPAGPKGPTGPRGSTARPTFTGATTASCDRNVGPPWDPNCFYEDTEGAWVSGRCPSGYAVTGVYTRNWGQGGHNRWQLICKEIR